MTDANTDNTEKRKQFDANPDDFVYRKDLCIAVEVERTGLKITIGNTSRSMLLLALSDVTFRVHEILRAMEIERKIKEEQEKRIVTPNA